MNNIKIIFIIFVMALVTYLPRVIPMAVFRKKVKNKFIQSFLLYIPYGVLSAMIFPDIIYSTESLASAICGMVVALILSYKNLGLLPVTLGATGTVFIVERFFSFL